MMMISPANLYQNLHRGYLRARYLRRHLESIDRTALEKIRARHAEEYYSKYFDYDTYLIQNLDFATFLGLHRRRPLDILDLGCGFGYFPLICMNYGHRVIGTDIAGCGLFDEVIQVLGIDRRTFAIQPYEPLPDFGRQFDLITALMVSFDRYDHSHRWSADEWSYFLTDVSRRLLQPGGRLFLYLNKNKATGQCYDDSTRSLFLARGAKIHLKRVYFSDAHATLSK